MGFRHPLPPVLRVRFELADGSLLERDWTVSDEVPAILRIYGGPPPWLDEPRRTWEKVRDPVTLRGRVKPGFEDVAREVVLG